MRAQVLHSNVQAPQEDSAQSEPGESLQEAAVREAHEETGLLSLPSGRRVWKRKHTYRFNGQVIDVAEEWLLHTIEHFTPTPARLSDSETQSILGFRWWSAEELAESSEIIYPPQLGRLLTKLLTEGVPQPPIDISD